MITDKRSGGAMPTRLARIDFTKASKRERNDYSRKVLSLKFTSTGEINVAMVETARTIGRSDRFAPE